MQSKLVDAIALASSPIAVVLTDEKPETALQIKQGGWGCVSAFMLAVSKGRTAVFDRNSYGCPGGGVGLGFGNAYEEKHFAIDKLLSSGDPQAAKQQRAGSHMAEGERFFKTPDLVRRWVGSMPITELPTEYVVMKPLQSVSAADAPDLLIFLVNPDQLSALVTISNFSRASPEHAIAPFGAACQSILYGYAEARREVPRGVLGFFDIAQRNRLPRDILSYTVPWKMFEQMEANVADSFLQMEDWQKLRKRQ